MTELVLYHFPGACSQVCVFALESASLAYELRLIDLAANQQSSADYLAISPLGKVPALLIDGLVLTENAAIQTYISELCPEAGLFPSDHSPLALARRQAGFSFCGGTLHPTIRGIANPVRMTTGDVEPVREKSIYLANKLFQYAETKLAEQGWWLGEWSILDVYLNWTVSVARNAGFDFSKLPLLDGLKDLLAERPAFRRMMEIDSEARTALEAKRKVA